MRQVSNPKDLPWVRRSLVEGFAPGVESGGQALEGSGIPRSWAPGMAELGRAMVSGLQRAELYWVTRPMTELALDAAIDIPEWTVESARPSPSGIIWWAGQLPPVNRSLRRSDAGWGSWAGDPNVRSSDRVHPAGAMWWTAPSNPAYNVREPMLGLALLARSAEVDPEAPDEAAALTVWSTMLPLTGPPVPDEYQPEVTGVVALLGATWHMMMEPKVASPKPVEMPRKDRDRARRNGESTADITTVDLRTIRHVDTDPDKSEGSARHLTVRHYVRGHWRRQYMHSTRTHEPRYIAPYIKGPAAAPLCVKERVMVWRR